MFDYATPVEELSLRGGLRYSTRLKAAAMGGEPWRSFYRPAALAAQLRALGFSQLEDLGSEELNRRYFAARSDRLRCAGPGRLLCAPPRCAQGAVSSVRKRQKKAFPV